MGSADPRWLEVRNLSESSVPECLDTQEFREIWAIYIDYRRSMRWKILQPISVEIQLRRLSRLGSALAVECIELSLANGWQGLFPDRFTDRAHEEGGKGPRKVSVPVVYTNAHGGVMPDRILRRAKIEVKPGEHVPAYLTDTQAKQMGV